MKPVEPLQRLASRLARLPGVGRRSAERMVLRLAMDQRGLRRELITVLQEVEDQVTCCAQCGNFTLKTQDPCSLCTDTRRNRRLLCIVEDPGGIQSVESAGVYQGLYYCLMGKLSPMQGQDVPPETIQRLIRRIRDGGVTEIILALDSDVESDATASYLHDMLEGEKVTVSRLAFGIPAGSGLSYSDPITLARALDGRQRI